MRCTAAVVVYCLVAGCHREVPAGAASAAQTSYEEREELHHPGWIAELPASVDDVRRCTEDRLPPSLVIEISSRPSGATGVTSVDGQGIVERCAVLDGRIVHRGRIRVDPDELAAAGLPVFSLGSAPPNVEGNVLLEEVHDDQDGLIGWLYWPEEAKDQTSGGANVPRD